MLAYTKLVFDNQNFMSSAVPGRVVPGASLIAYLSISEVDPWHQLAIVFAFVIGLRVVHFVLLWLHVFPYVKYQLSISWTKFVSVFRVGSPFGASVGKRSTHSNRSTTMAL